MDRKQTALEILARLGKVRPEDLRPEVELVADLGFDSSKALELVVELEDALGIEIEDETAGSLQTVGDVLRQLDALAPGS